MTTQSASKVTTSSFLAGTLIATSMGDVAVEHLMQGDQVINLEHGAWTASPVRSLERREIDLIDPDQQAACESAAPVRIHAHAFAANVPAHDLLIAQEQCILVDGGLIPARMLVNGASIVQERSLLRYTMHHLECDQHAILLASGLSIGSPTTDASVPHALMEPLRRRLLARAKQLGLVAPAAPRADTPVSTAALCLRLDDGTVLRARNRTGERHFFVMPAGNDHAILLQRDAVPAPGEGMLVRSATLWMALSDIAIPLAASWLQARHAPSFPGQPDHIDGEAEITFDAMSQATVLELTLTEA
jgi:hypothetical protein